MTDETSFKQFGTHFQETVMQALLNDQNWARQMIEVINPDYFELKYLNYLSRRYFDYARKYRVFPTFALLASIVRDELTASRDVALKDQVIDYMNKVYEGREAVNNDLPYVKEKSLDFCKRQALFKALEESIGHIEKGDYDTIVGGIRKAIAIGTCVSSGLDLTRDFECRYTPEQRAPITTGYKQIDVITRGGLGVGELGYVIAPTGVGKSHMLVDMGVSALMAGYNVMHFPLEMKNEETALRYDSNVLKRDINELVVDSKDLIEARVKEVKAGYSLALAGKTNRLFVKSFPPKAATVNTLMSHIEHLQSVENFKPDAIFVDYLDLMSSTRHYEQLRLELELISQELIALARDLNVSMWTATQSNKEGVRADVIDTSNMAEGFSKAFGATLVLALMRKPHEKNAGSAKVFVAKNRIGKDGLLFHAKFDGAQSRIELLGDAMSLEQRSSASDKDSASNAIDILKKQSARRADKNASNKWSALVRSDISLEEPQKAVAS